MSGIAYVGGYTLGAQSGAPALTHGLSIEEGDSVFCYFNLNGDAQTLTPDDDWTTKVNEQPGGTETSRQILLHRYATGNDPATYNFTLGGSDYWRAVIKVFRARAPLQEVNPAATDYRLTSHAWVRVASADGRFVPANSVSVIFGGKDDRGIGEAYTDASDGYGSVLGDTEHQLAAAAHKIYYKSTTIVTAAGYVRIDTADDADGTSARSYSTHIVFAEAEDKTVLGPAILQVPRLLRYPQNPKINKNHWQGQNLLSFWPLVNSHLQGGHDLLGYKHLTYDATAARHPTAGPIPGVPAVGSYFDGSQYHRISTTEGFDELYSAGPDSFTIMMRCRGTDIGVQHTLTGDYSASASNQALYLRVDAGNTWTVNLALDDGGHNIWQQGTYAQDTTYSVALVIDWDSKGAGLFINGELIGGVAFPSATDWGAGKGWQPAIGNYRASGDPTTFGWVGWLWDYRIYRGALSSEKVMAIHRNPLDVFAPQNIYLGAPDDRRVVVF